MRPHLDSTSHKCGSVLRGLTVALLGLLAFGSPFVAGALEVRVNQLMQIRTSQGETLVDAGQVQPGATVEIPDKFVLTDSTGKVNIERTLDRWLKASGYSDAEIQWRGNTERNDFFFPVRVNGRTQYVSLRGFLDIRDALVVLPGGRVYNGTSDDTPLSSLERPSPATSKTSVSSRDDSRSFDVVPARVDAAARVTRQRTSPSSPTAPPPAAPASSSCYDPLNEQAVIAIYGRPFLNRIEPILRRAVTDFGVDPRLIYYRMIGEARGNPRAVQPGVGAYGIFQFEDDRHRNAAKALCNGVSDDECRYRQVNYYVAQYVGSAARWLANGTAGCPPWRSMSNFQKVAILGFGQSCPIAEGRERSFRQNLPASYDISVIRSLDRQPRLCETWGTSDRASSRGHTSDRPRALSN